MTHKLALFILIIFCLILVGSWYKVGLIIGGAEETLSFYDLKKTRQLYEYTWEEVNYGGPQTATMSRYPYFVFLEYLNRLGIPADLLQIITFFILVFSSGFFVYVFAKEALGNKPIYCLLAALFYILNPFVFFNIWNRFLVAMFFFEPLLPASLYFLFKAFKTNSILYLIIFVLSSFILSSAFSLPSNIITLWVVLFLLLIAKLIENRRFFKSLLKPIVWFLVFFASWILVNLWWLIPLNYQATLVYSPIFGTNENLAVLRSISNQFPFLSTIMLGYKNMLSMFHMIISFIMLLVIWFGFKEVKFKDIRNFFLILIILSYFVLNGSNFPTGKIFEFFFERISQLQLFRNPYEKFGIVLVFVYSILFSQGIKGVLKFSRTLAIFLMVLIFIFLFIPFWTGKVFGDENINFYVKIPDDYIQINKLLNQDKDDFRILHLPLLANDSAAYNWPNKYFGLSPNFQLFDKPSLEGPTQVRQEPDNYWRIVREGFYNGKINQLLKYANIKYLLLHKDIDTDYSQSEDIETTKFYLQNGIMPNSLFAKNVCSNLSDLRYYSGGSKSFAECKIDSSNSDWSAINFLHFEINSNSSGKIRIDIVDSFNQRLVFEGKVEDMYEIAVTETDRFKSFNLNLKVPTERYAKFSLFNIDHLEIVFIPNVQSISPSVKVRNVYPDDGRKISNDYLSLVSSTANLELYKVQNRYFYPKIYAAKDLLKLNNWQSLLNIDLLPESFYLSNQQVEGVNYDLFLEKPEIAFKKLNNTKYTIFVKNAKTSFWLIFSETFSPEWKAKSDNQEFQHFPANGYANGYFVDRTGDFTIDLIYQQQVLADKLKSVSFIMFILIISCALMIAGGKFFKKKFYF